MTNKKIKILQLTRAMHIGGAEKVIYELALKVNEENFDVTIGCLSFIGTIGEKYLQKRKDIQLFNKKRITKYLNTIDLIKWVKKNKIDIIHSHGTAALFEGAIAKLIYPKASLIHTFHFGNYPNMKKKYLLGERLFTKFSDRLIAVSEQQRDAVIKHLKINKKKINTVYNGTGENKYVGQKKIIDSVRNEFGIRNDEYLIGAVAVLTRQKGIKYLIETARILRKRKNIKFLIVGDGPLKEELSDLTNRYNVNETVIFSGWRTDVKRLLAAFDIFLMTSLWEGLPIALLEAIAAGKPVITTKVGDNDKIVNDGVNGYLVDTRNPEQMADCILKILGNEVRKKKMQENAIKIYKRSFSIEKMVKAYEIIYNQIAGKKPHMGLMRSRCDT
jgi:glycosyltransferase involved in cell wall biosynthesis